MLCGSFTGDWGTFTGDWGTPEGLKRLLSERSGEKKEESDWLVSALDRTAPYSISKYRTLEIMLVLSFKYMSLIIKLQHSFLTTVTESIYHYYFTVLTCLCGAFCWW